MAESDGNVENKSPGWVAAEKFYGMDEDPASAIPERTNIAEEIDAEDRDAPTSDDDQRPNNVRALHRDERDDDQQQDSESESAGDEVRTLSELVESIGVDDQWIEDLEVTRKINGEEMTFRLGDILDGSDKYSAADDYLADAKRKSKELVESAKRRESELGESVVVLGTLLQTVEDELKKESQGVNWAELRKTDPAEYTARKEDLRDREEKLNNLKTQAAQNYREALERAKKSHDDQLRAKLPEEKKVLHEKLPDWAKNIKKAEKEAADVIGYLREGGMDPEALKEVLHSGTYLSMAVKAMRYDNIQNKSNVEDKRVRKIPRILRPGAEQRRSDRNANDQNSDRADILYS